MNMGEKNITTNGKIWFLAKMKVEFGRQMVIYFLLNTSSNYKFSDFLINPLMGLCISLYIHTSRQPDQQLVDVFIIRKTEESGKFKCYYIDANKYQTIIAMVSNFLSVT